MKKIKTGYTLSEVLVTLGIIGVIAALTVPSVFSSSNKATIAPALYKTVELIESGMRNVMQGATDRAESAQAAADQTEIGTVTTTLDTISFNDLLGNNSNTHVITSATMFDNLRGYIGANTLSANKRAYLQNAHNYSGNALIRTTYGFITNAAYSFQKNNSIFVYEPAVDNNITRYMTLHNNYLPDDVVVARIIIDANGDKAPNRLGQDIFLFGLTNNGHLVPAGSEAYNKNVFNNGAGVSIPLYTTAQGCSNGDINTGVSCAARVAADNWKINYK